MTKRVVGYFENWAQYRQAGGKFFPAQINPSFFTHINFAFGLFGFVTWSVDQNPARTGPQRYTGDYTVQPVEWNDQTVLYPAIQALKQKNSSLKTLLSIGGWSMNSCSDTPNSGNEHPYGPYTCQLFSQMAADPNGRAQFINSAIAYAKKYGFDGIDIDWEYPGYVGRGGGSNDLANLLALAQEFRAAAGPNFLLTMAAPAIVPTGLPQSYHDDPSTFFSWLQQCSQSFDWLNIMSYDYHGAFDDPVKIGTGVNAPLPQDSTPNGPFSVFQTVTTYLAAGIAADKMVLGMPTYGRAYTVANPAALASNSSYGQPFSGPAPAGPATQTPGVLAYYEIEQQIASGALTTAWDNATLTPYAYSAKTGEWVSYDNPESLAYKTAYVNAENLGGAMIWSIDDDDFANGYPLLSKITDILNNPADGPPLPGPITSPINFPLDLLGLFVGDWSSNSSVDARAERDAAAPPVLAVDGSGTPGLASFYGQFYAAYEGPNANGTLNFQTYDPVFKTFSGSRSFGNQNMGITGPPALAAYDNKLFCVHEGGGQSGRLYYCFIDGENASDIWSDETAFQELPIGGTVAGSTRHGYPTVALAVFQNKLHCVFEGGSNRGGGQLWHIVYNAAAGDAGGAWGPAERIRDFGTSGGPGLAVATGELYCLHEGAYQDGQMWWTHFDGKNWSDDTKMNIPTSGPPALMSVNRPSFSRLYVTHAGAYQSSELRSPDNATRTDEVIPGSVVPGTTISATATAGTGLLANINGNGTLTTETIGVQQETEDQYFDLTIPTTRFTAPYPPLDRYSTDLKEHAEYNNAQNDYPVVVIRNHVIPLNLLVSFWNTVVRTGDVGAPVRAAGVAIGLLMDMSRILRAGSTYQTTMIQADREVVASTLDGIRYGEIVHRLGAPRAPGWDNFCTLYSWLPGNLFIGPQPTQRSDDPGEALETNAGVVVGLDDFRKYNAAYAAIQTYQLTFNPLNARQAMSNLAEIANEKKLFALNAANWTLRHGKYSLVVIQQTERVASAIMMPATE